MSNPNWSKLAALFRTLVILGASSFVGAIVLPLATDGTLPITWAAWRPILAVAGSAAVVSEFIWIKTHLQQAAQAIGVLSSDPATTPAVRAALLKVGLGAILILLPGCTPTGQLAQGASSALNVTEVSLKALVCGLDVITTDESTTPPAPATQLAFDLAANCGMDAVAIANLFGAQNPVTAAAQSNGAQVQAKVDAWRASHSKK